MVEFGQSIDIAMSWNK